MSQRIEYTTDDGIKIVGSWVTAPTTVGAAILVHAYPNTKESWGAFQIVLSKRGIASLAIDLRGHGESIQTDEGRTLDYRAFTDEETLSSMNDLRGAYDWIRRRGIDREAIVFIGASIGANLSLRLLSELPTSPAAVLLSPGMNYHGVTIEDVVENICTQQGVWMAASAEDDDESVEAAAMLNTTMEIPQKVFKKLRRAGHGTMIIEGDAVLSGEIADWARDRIQSFDLEG
jgi:pimeloyl-ACP methyl ester carboxylesterase